MKRALLLGCWVAVAAGCGDETPSFVGVDAGDEQSPIDVAEDVVIPTFDVGALDTGGCAGGQSRCGAACLDLQNSVDNCGVCGRNCRNLLGVVADAVRCVRGQCDLTGACVAGRAHCTPDSSNGCETDITTSARCGSCSVRCEGATPTCSMRRTDGGAPRLECSSDCAELTPTRCGSVCVDLNTSLVHCGVCNTSCPVRANARNTCTAGVCGVECNPGYADCDGIATNGCEVNTNTSLSHCGACGTRCAASTGMTATCTAGVCATACTTGFADCDGNAANGCETNTRTDVMRCGSCTNACPAGANSTPTCSVGVCRATCMTGFADCDAMVATGCETDVRASMTDCGACRRACTAPPNGTAMCAASLCQITCAAGFYVSGSACVPLPAPLLISPLSTSRVTSRRPTLTWRNTTPANGARIELCRERACATVVRSVEVTGTSTTLTEDLAPGVWYWRGVARRDLAAGLLPSSVWEFTVGPRSAPVDASFGASLDVNGDGFGDLAVGGSEGPLAYVYHGSATGLPTTASAMVTAPTTTGTMGFGRTLTTGDVNGDGYGDLVVVAPVGASRAYVYHGGTGGLGASVSTTVNSSLAGFGAAVATMGDINNDGCADVAFGVATMGRVLIHTGTRTGLLTSASYTFTGPAGSLFGQSVAGVGDMTGDGFEDMVVGAPGANAAYVFHGTASSVSTVVSAMLVGGAGVTDYGTVVAALGDVNGDGLTDVAVSAPGASRVDVFHGRLTGLSAAPAITLTGAIGTGFGASLVGAGDLNGDGFSDLAVGSSMTREVRVYFGGASGLSATPALTLVAPMDATNFAASLAGVPDADGDLFGELAVGAHGAATVFVYRGAMAPAITPAVTVRGPASVGFGFALVASPR